MEWALTLLGYLIKPFERIRKRPIVLVHTAVFSNPSPNVSFSPSLKYFIKVINPSEVKDYTITHIWIEDMSKRFHILNRETHLPHKLKPSDIFETWVDVSKIKDSKENVFVNVRVKLTTGKVLKSKHNKDVPFEGMIGGINVSDYPT
ncbi:MAG: hypothetical protein KAS71_13735 [Bacteroidales bacterium]|nr:hypothetical protein [Bacteroidales bacterium]